MNDISFAEEPADRPPKETHHQKILIVDDDKEIHGLTKDAIEVFSLLDKHIECLSAYSAEEAKDVLKRESNIAVILLDAIMETEDAGFRLIKHIRHEMKNTNIRIIFRTGYSGNIPERTVIRNYDIDAYIDKTSFSLNQLFSSILVALRLNDSLIKQEHQMRGMERIINLHKKILPNENPISPENTYSAEILTELRDILCMNEAESGSCSGFVALLPGEELNLPIVSNAIYADRGHIIEDKPDTPVGTTQHVLPEDFVGDQKYTVDPNAKVGSVENNKEASIEILSALGKYETVEKKFRIPDTVLQLMKESCDSEGNVSKDGNVVVYFKNKASSFSDESKSRILYYLEGFPEISEENQKLLDLFMGSIFHVYHRIWDID